MRSVTALVFAVFLSAQPALADYKADYKSYLAALEAGDLAAAAEAGERAWRAAETELGDHKTTAILAFNFANTVAAQNPAKAIEAYERALALVDRGVSDLSQGEVEIALLGSRFDRDPSASAARALREALDRYRTAGEPATDRTIAGWRRLALSELGGRSRNPTLDEVDGYLGEAERIAPPDKRRLAEAQVVAGVGRIAGAKRSDRDIAEAVVLFDRAIAQFPPQAGIDSFDPLLATALAWRGSVKSLISSSGSDPFFKTGSRIAVTDDLRKAYEEAEAGYDLNGEASFFAGSPAACAVEWAERKPPPYPRGAVIRSSVGTVLIGYDLDETGVDRAVLLADLYGTGFGEAAIKAMDAWRLARPVEPACRKNRLTFFNFILG